MVDKDDKKIDQQQEPVNLEEVESDKPNQGNVVFKTEIVPEELPEEEVAPEDLSPQNFPESDAGAPIQPDTPQESKKTTYLVVVGMIILFLVIFFTILKFLGFFGGAPAKKITLEYWGLWEDESIMSPLIADYRRKNPNIEIKYSKRDPQNYREKLLARSREGRGPDIFRYHSTWIPTIKEVLSPIPGKLMSNQQFEKTFYSLAAKDLKVDKFYYAIPLEIDGLVLIYNNDLFKKAGIELPPKSWEDIIDYASRLTVKNVDSLVTSGIALGTANNIEHFSEILGWMLLQNGAELEKLTEQAAVDTLEQYRRFAEPPDNTWDENMPNSISAFIQGKVAMVFAPSWQIITIKSANPDLDVKVVPLPKVPGGTDVAISNYWVEGVSKFSKNQFEAWRFLVFLADKENMTKLYSEEAKTRLFGEPYSRIDLKDKLSQNEYIGSVLQQADRMKTLPLVARTYDNGLNDEVVKYLENAVNATSQGVSYREAFTTASRGILQTFSKYGIK